MRRNLERNKVNLLEGSRVFLVPIGSDISRKRLEVLANNIERLGGKVVWPEQNKVTREELLSLPKIAVSSPNSTARKRSKHSFDARDGIKRTKHSSAKDLLLGKFMWEQIDIAVVSSRIDKDQLQAVYNLQCLPCGITWYTPEWITFMIQEKRHPNSAEKENHHLIWPTKKQDIRGDEKDVGCMQVEKASQLPESNDESENDSPPYEKLQPDQPVLHPEVQKLEMEKLRHVMKHAEIFHKNNPNFKPVSSFPPNTNTNTSASFVCQKTSCKEVALYSLDQLSDVVRK